MASSVGHRHLSVLLAATVAFAGVPRASASGVPAGCNLVDEIVDLKRIFEDVSHLDKLRDMMAQVEKARERRGADQPRYFETIRFKLKILRDLLLAKNTAGAISQLKPVADVMLTAYVTVRRVEAQMQRAIGMKKQIESLTEIPADVGGHLLAREAEARPLERGEPPRQVPRLLTHLRFGQRAGWLFWALANRRSHMRAQFLMCAPSKRSLCGGVRLSARSPLQRSSTKNSVSGLRLPPTSPQPWRTPTSCAP